MNRMKFTVKREVTSGGPVFVKKMNLRWDQLKPQEKKSKIRNGLLASAAAIALGVVSLPNGPVDAWGDLSHPLNTTEKNDLFSSKMSDQERFKLQYLGGEVEVDNGSGFLGSFMGPVIETPGSDCLASTAYDTPDVRLEDNGGVVTVSPVRYDNIGMLTLNVGEDGKFAPVNDLTKDLLKSYGCNS